MRKIGLETKGSKIPINDMWIAACCMEVGGTLLTRDNHFKLVDQIESVVLKNQRISSINRVSFFGFRWILTY